MTNDMERDAGQKERERDELSLRERVSGRGERGVSGRGERERHEWPRREREA